MISTVVRSLALLSLLLAAAAQAQDREPSFLPRAAVETAGVVGGVGAVVGMYYVIPSWYDTPTGASILVLAYPAGLALGTALASNALGLDAPLDRVMTDAALGAVVGAAAGAVVGGLAAGTTYIVFQDDWGLISALVGIGAGGLTALSVSSVVASRRVEAAPTPLRAPTGERGAGLTLSISF